MLVALFVCCSNSNVARSGRQASSAALSTVAAAVTTVFHPLSRLLQIWSRALTATEFSTAQTYLMQQCEPTICPPAPQTTTPAVRAAHSAYCTAWTDTAGPGRLWLLPPHPAATCAPSSRLIVVFSPRSASPSLLFQTGTAFLRPSARPRIWPSRPLQCP